MPGFLLQLHIAEGRRRPVAPRISYDSHPFSVGM